MDRGVLYKTSGEQYIEEAKTSARSVRAVMPDVPIALATDEEVDSDLFDRIIELDYVRKDWGASLLSADLSPFDRTLYLDPDTYVCREVSGLFEILDEYELAVAFAPLRGTPESMSEPWTSYNTGVFSYSSTNRMKEFLETWNEIYEEWREEKDIVADQPAFTRTVKEVHPKLFTLPSEYNTRVPYPGFLGDEAKIIHGRHGKSLRSIGEELNSVEGRRVFWTNSYRSFGHPFHIRAPDLWEGYSRLRFSRVIHQKGLKYLMKQGFRTLYEKVL